MHSNHQYNKSLKSFATQKRYEMTKAEACLWKYALSSKKMLGYTFNRQRPVLRFIADFMCKELDLIIEVDGYSHQLEEVYEKDLERQNKLEEAGFTVLRFKDADVLKNIKHVRTVISNTMEELEKEKKVVLPLPPPEGDTPYHEHLTKL
jgi:very-short-patch-repair endonuclease